MVELAAASRNREMKQAKHGKRFEHVSDRAFCGSIVWP
jgi:hypothetical protein